MAMRSRERLLTAINRGVPDRLPVTTHHLMSFFLNKSMGGMSNQAFFEHFGLDAIHWIVPHRPDTAGGEYYDPDQGEPGFLESRRIASDQWRVKSECMADPHYATTRYRFVTPRGELTMVLQANEHTSWVVEHLIKEKGTLSLSPTMRPHPNVTLTVSTRKPRHSANEGWCAGIFAALMFLDSRAHGKMPLAWSA